MRKHDIKQLVVWWCSLAVLAVLLAACTSASNNSGNTGNQSQAHKAATPNATTAVTSATPNSNNTKPSNGPIVILSPTPVPGGNAGSQQIVLPDRTIVITSITKQNSSTKGATIITMVLTVKNTGSKAISNQSSYYQLVSSEGDVFAPTSSATNTSFFGTIATGSSLNGTLNFEIPSATLSNLRLLYRPDVATDTVFVVLHV